MAQASSFDCSDLRRMVYSDHYSFTIIDHMGPSSRYLSLVDSEVESIHTLAQFRNNVNPEVAQEIVRMLNGQAEYRNRVVMDLSIHYIRNQMDARSVDVSDMSDADLRVFIEDHLTEKSFQVQVMDEIEHHLQMHFEDLEG